MVRRRRGLLVAVMAALAAGLTLAACGGDDGGDSSASAGSTNATAGAGSCGTVPTQKPNDPDGLLADLGSRYDAAYNGWGGTLQASPWADWKPKGEKLTVGISLERIVNPWAAEFVKAVQAELKRSPVVGKIIVKTGDDAVPTQVRQYQSIVDAGADIVLIQPRAPQPFVAPIDAAAKKGVPTISIINRVPNPNVVNVNPNTWLQGAVTAAGVAKVVGGKGSFLYVHGISATQGDKDAFAGAKAALSRCPDIKLAGEVEGAYAPPTVKSETLKFLSTHPAKLDGVLQTASMAPSIIQAFQQAGKDVPPVADPAAQKGSLGYWNENKSSYETVGTLSGAQGMAKAVATVAVGLLQGRGIKINDVVVPTTPITKDNLASLVDPSWNVGTQGTVDGDGNYYVSDGYVESLFSHAAQ